MVLGQYRYVVVLPSPPSGKWNIRPVPEDSPPVCFGFFQTLSAAAAHMRFLGIRFPQVSVWDRAKHEYAAHLFQEPEAIDYDPIWPLLQALVRLPDGNYKEIKYAQDHTGTLTEKS